MTTPEQLAARYGRTHDAARRTRGIVIGSAVAFVVVLVAWLWWAGLLAPSASFEAKDTGHTIESDSSVSVTWQFTAEPGTAASCAVQALNSTFGIVSCGWMFRMTNLWLAEWKDQYLRLSSVVGTRTSILSMFYKPTKVVILTFYYRRINRLIKHKSCISC